MEKTTGIQGRNLAGNKSNVHPGQGILGVLSLRNLSAGQGAGGRALWTVPTIEGWGRGSDTYWNQKV